MSSEISRNARFALTGLQTGVTGAFAMLVWFGTASLLARRSVWWIPNLVSSAHYGQASVRYGAGIYTLVGIATILVFYGTAGMLFGLSARETPGSFRLLCFGLVVSLVLYWALERWFWKSANPVGHLYTPGGQLLLAHLIYGFFLARYPATLRRNGFAFTEAASGH